MGNGCNFFSIVRMIWSVLHETIHDVISWRTKSLVIDAWDSKIHEGGETDSMSFGLLVCFC